MSEKKYEVYERGEKIASDLNLSMALLLMQAYCEKYYMEQTNLTLLEMDRCEVKESEE